jgi:two-component system, cell cycle response regulator
MIKVLLVEDSEEDARFVQEMLKDVVAEEYSITHVDRLCNALTHLRAEKPDVILLDLSLPDSFGLDTLRQVHAEGSEIPIVITSGFSDEALVFQPMKEGAQDYLVKGEWSHRMLARAIRYAMDRKGDENKLRDILQQLQQAKDELTGMRTTRHRAA